MTAAGGVEAVRAALGDRARGWTRPSPRRAYADVDPGALPDACRVMGEALGARLQTATGIDGPREIEVLYHWALDGEGTVVSLRTRVDRARPELPSIVPVCPAAEWIERELQELLGLGFRGHPDPRHLLLAEDWPSGSYPLRRDFRRGAP